MECVKCKQEIKPNESIFNSLWYGQFHLSCWKSIKHYNSLKDLPNCDKCMAKMGRIGDYWVCPNCRNKVYTQ